MDLRFTEARDGPIDVAVQLQIWGNSSCSINSFLIINHPNKGPTCAWSFWSDRRLPHSVLLNRKEGLTLTGPALGYSGILSLRFTVTVDTCA